MRAYSKLLFFSFTICFMANASDISTTDRISENLAIVNKAFEGMTLTGFGDQEIGEAPYTEEDLENFLVIVSDLRGQIETEVYLHKNSNLDAIAAHVLGTIFSATSWALSGLYYLPTCMISTCEEGYTLMRSAKHFCVQQGFDEICMRFIKSTYDIKDALIENAYYVRDCAPALPEELVATKIPLAEVSSVSSEGCENFARPLLAVPSIIVGAVGGSFLVYGTGKLSYVVYQKLSLRKNAQKNYGVDARHLAAAMSTKFPVYKELIAFIIEYAVMRNPETHRQWSAFSPSHKARSYFFGAKVKND